MVENDGAVESAQFLLMEDSGAVGGWYVVAVEWEILLE